MLSVLTLAHSIISAFQLFICLVLYFKIPSTRDADIEFEDAVEEKLYLKWQVRRNKLLIEQKEIESKIGSQISKNIEQKFKQANLKF